MASPFFLSHACAVAGFGDLIMQFHLFSCGQAVLCIDRVSDTASV